MKFFDFVKTLNPYARPKSYVYIGMCLSSVQGSVMPIFALLLTKALFNM